MHKCIYYLAVTKATGKIQVNNRRSTTTTYDIDNIIIDPSVAAVGRIEVLQYKEIATPRYSTPLHTD